MLSEHHDIDHEFPEYHQQLEALVAADAEFAELVAHHDRLDDEIRELEERGLPIADENIEAMKFRARRSQGSRSTTDCAAADLPHTAHPTGDLSRVVGPMGPGQPRPQNFYGCAVGANSFAPTTVSPAKIGSSAVQRR